VHYARQSPHNPSPPPSCAPAVTVSQVRSIGSLVYADDQVILQSVKYEALLLGATEPAAARPAAPAAAGRRRGGGVEMWSVGHCAPVPALNLRVPMALRREAKAEVNGSLELRCFTMKLYGRPSKGVLVTGLHRFRLFHPETNGALDQTKPPSRPYFTLDLPSVSTCACACAPSSIPTSVFEP
jgi:hypothetical protein